jgi:asparagine synthase (glutamine-hydrolysing)
MKNASPTMLKLFFGYKLEDSQNPLYSHLLRWNNASHIKKHFQPFLLKMKDVYDPYEEVLGKLPKNFDNWNSLAKAQYLEASVFLSGYLLSSQGDRMGMGNSIEGRYPFLDHRLIEFCNSLPPGFKLNGLDEKFLLKKVIKGKIPESIVKRSKQAYRAPIASTFLSSIAPDYVQEALNLENVKNVGVFGEQSVNALLKKVRNSERPSEIENMSITAIISTYLVHEQFINNYHSINKNNLLKPRIINDRV